MKYYKIIRGYMQHNHIKRPLFYIFISTDRRYK